jgi:hypothetical protein
MVLGFLFEAANFIISKSSIPTANQSFIDLWLTSAHWQKYQGASGIGSTNSDVRLKGCKAEAGN